MTREIRRSFRIATHILVFAGLVAPAAAKVERQASAAKPPAQIGEHGSQQGAQQCAAETRQRHQSIVSSMKGRPTHEIAQAIADSDAKNPSLAECTRKKGGGGGGDDTTSIMADNSTGNPELDGTNDAANASAAKTPDTSSATSNPDQKPNPKPNPNKKKLEIGAIAAAGTAGILLGTHGGGGDNPPSGTGGGGPSYKWDPTGANGVFMADVQLQPTFAFGPTSQAVCQGSQSAYAEKATVKLNSSGAGTVTLDDTPGFQRVYQVSGITEYNVSATSSGSFPFFSGQVPGTLTVSFSSNTSMNFKETTTFGSCSNTYSGVLTRQ